MMILTVKILPGGRKECSIEVMDQEPILSVKRMVARELDVPVHLQRLVFRGKTLSDGSALNDYNIGPNTKIHLVVRKPETECDPLHTSRIGTNTEFWEKLRLKLNKHFTNDNAEKILHQFKMGFSSDVCNLSLDEIERLAISKENKDGHTDQAGTSR
ncbi:ubiquitin-like protein 4A [Anneissia japonica]|uniref:ubiquitin-like protein 4A n=1 Tax=Anneissia japonica TaxID=1529436 RepID=UPI0014257E60|nr:ubiquitin-like protein 4A [Anneissia japonica]